MENSENKSLISTGSSNLTKTEKLLSITQKILSEIKPQYESVRIGNQEWMTRNLDVDRFRNGDLIPHIESDEEWREAGKNGQPAWCYYDNNPENGRKYGKLYNWFAVADSKGLTPKGWHVPSDEEWTSLVEYLGKDVASHKMKSIDGWVEWEDLDGEIQKGVGDNSSGFNSLPGGFRCSGRSFCNISSYSHFWSSTEYDNSFAWFRSLYYNYSDVYRNYNILYNFSKSSGASVRCLRNP